MPAKIVLTVQKGILSGKTFAFAENEQLVIGRQPDCPICMPDASVSRYHCLMEIAPPIVRVRDFGSKNGTYLNGELIGDRADGEVTTDGWQTHGQVFSMKHGDRLGLGKNCELFLEVFRSDGTPDTQHEAFTTATAKHCEVCGEPLPPHSESELCAACYADPNKVLTALLAKANKYDDEAFKVEGYQNIELLGWGGMGQVWLVEEVATGKRMALKVLRSKADVSKMNRELFVREAKIAAQLSHKNIVHQYKFDRIGDDHFILMEYCDGGNVEELVDKSGGQLSIDLATNIILQVLDGLIYAHSAPITAELQNGKTENAHGIVHRDLKPSNILLTGEKNSPTVKISDFGLAKAFETAGLSDYTKTAQHAGTFYFMARQQFSQYKYSLPEVDCWAAMASYYYMLTGFPPKEFSQYRDPVYTALSGNSVPIRKRNAHIPQRLAEVIDAALIDTPDIGIRNAMELKKQIESAL